MHEPYDKPSYTPAEFQRLAMGVKTNNLGEVDAIISKHALHIRDPKFKERTYFIIACSGGFDAVVGKYLDYRKFDDETLLQGLHAASRIGDVDTVKLLISRCHLDPNKASTAGVISVSIEKDTVNMDDAARYPIAIAANEGRQELVGYFLGYQGIEIFNIFDESYTTGLDQFVVACMGGEGFLPLVDAYIQIGETKKDHLYQAIYLASRFGNDKAVTQIIEKYAESLDADFVTTLIDQGYADAKVYLAHPGNKDKSKIDKQRDAVTDMRSKFASIVGHTKLEHSSDEERLSGSGSESPKRLSDSDEPLSAGSDSSNNSPPSSPPKLASPPKPLSEKAKMLLSKLSPDQALRAATSFPLDVQKEIVDVGNLTFEVVNSTNENVFHLLVGCGYYEIAQYLINKYPHCVDTKNSDDQTALHLIMIGYGKPSSYLEHRDAEMSRLKKVNFLLDNHAKVKIADRFGKIPIEYAEKEGFKEVAALLRARSANEKDVSSSRSGVLRQPEITYSPSSQRQPASTTAPVSLGNAKVGMFTLPVVQQPALQVQPQPLIAKPVTQNHKPSSVVGSVHTPPPQTAANQQYQEKKKSSGVFGSLKGLISGSKKEDARISKSP